LIDQCDTGDDCDQDYTVTLGWCMFFCFVLYCLGYSSSWGGVPWVYPSEIFPLVVKERALATSNLSQWVGSAVIAQIAPGQLNMFKAYGAMLQFAFCILLGIAFVYFCVPETKGLSLEQMDELFGADMSVRRPLAPTSGALSGLRTPQNDTAAVSFSGGLPKPTSMPHLQSAPPQMASKLSIDSDAERGNYASWTVGQADPSMDASSRVWSFSMKNPSHRVFRVSKGGSVVLD